jgi:hypothetical protein
MGKLYDDRGNPMSPNYSTKNGIRYRFYVSSALLRGRKAERWHGWSCPCGRDRKYGAYGPQTTAATGPIRRRARFH